MPAAGECAGTVSVAGADIAAGVGFEVGVPFADRRSICLRSPRWKRNRAASLRLSVGDAKGCARDWGKTGPATIFL
jgi:hypothetical protein